MTADDKKYGEHRPVLLGQVLEYLPPLGSLGTPQHFLDMTFGGGGHSLAMLERFSQLKISAIDQDQQALQAAKEKLKQLGLDSHFEFFHDNFASVLASWKNGTQAFDMILADIGVSSHHLDDEERGFAFRHDGPLDMRMDLRQEMSAADIVNTYSHAELERIFTEYGEEKFASRIAKKIVEVRRQTPLRTTSELESLCFYSYPAALRHRKKHPATQVFQALRIEVNRELEVLTSAMNDAIDFLKPGGRLGIITFHSLEDRLVKRFFLGCQKDFPETFRVITKKPLVASEQEIALNKRSRSAKLRVLEKIKTS